MKKSKIVCYIFHLSAINVYTIIQQYSCNHYVLVYAFLQERKGQDLCIVSTSNMQDIFLTDVKLKPVRAMAASGAIFPLGQVRALLQVVTVKMTVG